MKEIGAETKDYVCCNWQQESFRQVEALTRLGEAEAWNAVVWTSASLGAGGRQGPIGSEHLE